MQSSNEADFSYYKPMNNKQADFHDSSATNKLLIGGLGAGKTYPAIHEAYFTCFDNPGHEYMVLKNTWDNLEDVAIKEFLRVGEASGAIKRYDKTKKNLVLTCNTTIRFRPLTLGIDKFKGENVCGFLIDDPDTNRYKDVMGFLFSRLRNPPNVTANYFETIITANWEGRNWIWQKYMRERDEGGDDEFAYWLLSTLDNPTLGDHFIKDLELIHSKSWMDRYVYSNIDQAYAGLVYNEYDPAVHDRELDFCDGNKDMVKIMAIDVGITDPTVVLKMACDNENIYIYDEWYRADIRSNVTGEYLSRQKRSDNFKILLIDPSAAKRDPVSGDSVSDNLRRDFGVNTYPANNDINYGIETCKAIFTVRDGRTHIFIDPVRCPNTIRELEIYKWMEPNFSEFDELAYREKPIDKDNHCMDAMRYGVTYLRKYIRAVFNKDNLLEERHKRLMEERHNKLRVYKRGVRNKNESKEMVKQHKTLKKRFGSKKMPAEQHSGLSTILR